MNEETFELREEELGRFLSRLTSVITKSLAVKQNPSILLTGELGAGKTTLVREWLKYVGSDDLANSPTFALHQIYEWNQIPIHHFDLYRIKEATEIEELGFSEIWGQEGISFIEWWNVAELLIPSAGRIYIDIQSITIDNRSYRLRFENL